MGIESEAARFFNGFARTFDTLYDGRRSFVMRWFDRHFRRDMFVRYEWTFKNFGELNGRTVLDIGCGSGPYLLEAIRRGARHVTGVDAAPAMLELARRKLGRESSPEKCSWIQGLFPDVQVKPHDHVIVMGVMDYVGDAGTFLARMKPLVGISAAVSFPSRHWLRTPLRALRYRVRRCPVYFYGEGEIQHLCERAGFGNIRIRKIAGAGMDYHVCLRP